MAKKDFTKALSGRKYVTIVNQKEQTDQKAEQSDNLKNEEQSPPNYTSRSIKIREDVFENLQALAWWNRKTMQELFTEVVEKHVAGIPEKELTKILDMYSGKK
ncbi:MAG: hypothetical protein KDD15_29650 [Lewinella sp.]|nr:hypothetical protein [Lewinella sp.]